MLKDRGMQKWKGMMLPEHTALLNEYFGEKKKVPKPELDEWALHEIEESLQLAIKRKCDVLLKIWEDGRLYIRGGEIARVDLQRRILELDDPFGLHTFSLDDIVDVTAAE
ncbi:YolD-like family protein [Psychrobacillus phage PVJ1]|nr:YolD-like family protein [Psychrobacillus phage PVJ1]